MCFFAGQLTPKAVHLLILFISYIKYKYWTINFQFFPKDNKLSSHSAGTDNVKLSFYFSTLHIQLIKGFTVPISSKNLSVSSSFPDRISLSSSSNPLIFCTGSTRSSFFETTWNTEAEMFSISDRRRFGLDTIRISNFYSCKQCLTILRESTAVKAATISQSLANRQKTGFCERFRSVFGGGRCMKLAL